MDPALPARLPLKMFHRVRHKDLGSVDASLFKRSIHNFAGGTNERLTRDVFVIPRLFAYQHHRCAFVAFAKNSLRRALIKMTGRACPRSLAHLI
jgi:hypothetical protein